jgi:hypothetical protein
MTELCQPRIPPYPGAQSFRLMACRFGSKRYSTVEIEATLTDSDKIGAGVPPDRCQEQQIFLESLPTSSTPSSISRIDLPLISTADPSPRSSLDLADRSPPAPALLRAQVAQRCDGPATLGRSLLSWTILSPARVEGGFHRGITGRTICDR